MKNLLLLAAFQCAATLLPGQSATDEQAMRIFTRDFMNAYNRQDSAALKALYTTDALTVGLDGDTIRGADHIAQGYENQFIRQDATLLVRQTGVTWSDAQHAYVVTGTCEVYGMTYVYDIPIHKTTAYSNVMVQENGQWKIARSIVTLPVKTVVYQKSADPATWKSALTGALNGSGVLTMETGTPQSDSGAVYALLEWPSLRAAQAFFAGSEWKKVVGTAGKGRKVVVSYLAGE